VTLPHEVPLALYIHLPWCVRKCPYCDFNSHALPSAGIPQQPYVAALLDDLAFAARDCGDREIVSVFFGGGTPSLFSPGSVAQVLRAARDLLAFAADVEVTLEANPGTVEAGRFRGFREAGVNRISIGVQSFDDAMLKALGRIHGAAEARRAIDAALASFDNVNLDVMYGLPGQTAAMARADLEQAVACGAPHVSAYQLTIEPNTAFWSKPPQLPEHDLCADMQLAAEEMLGAAGYEHYETSAFARTARRSRHNLNYWQFGDYLGIGAGAHGKVSFPDRITRHSRIKQPREYLAADDTLAEERVLSRREVPFEFMLNALRLTDGFEVKLFSERTGLSLSVINEQLAKAEKQGLLERDWQRIRPSARGRLFLNELLELFLDGESRDRG